MSRLAEAYVEITGRDLNMKKALDKAEKDVTRGTARMQKRLKAFASSMGQYAKKMGLVLGASIAAGLAVSVKAYMEQEKAEAALAAALKKSGSYTETRFRQLKQYASELQKVTIHGDEATIAEMAYAHNLGVTADQLEGTTKAAMGLATAYGMDLRTSMMLIGRASQGQTQMLTRYGIALDETLSPQEKFNQLLKIGAENFALTEAEAKTMAGKVKQLKDAAGDLAEKIGGALIPAIDDLVSMMKRFVTELEGGRGITKTIERYVRGFLWFRYGASLLVGGIWIIIKGLYSLVKVMFWASQALSGRRGLGKTLEDIRWEVEQSAIYFQALADSIAKAKEEAQDWKWPVPEKVEAAAGVPRGETGSRAVEKAAEQVAQFGRSVGGTIGYVTDLWGRYLDVYGDIAAQRLRLAGRTYDAERVMAVKAFKLAEYQAVSQTSNLEEQNALRLRAYQEYLLTIRDIDDRQREHRMTGLQGLYQLAEELALALTGIVKGETAQRIQAIDQQAAREKKAIADSIAGAEDKAVMMQALDAITADKKKRILDAEEKEEKRREMGRGPRFTTLRGVWQSAMLAGASMKMPEPPAASEAAANPQHQDLEAIRKEIEALRNDFEKRVNKMEAAQSYV